MAKPPAIIDQPDPGRFNPVKCDQVEHSCQKFIFGDEGILGQIDRAGGFGGLA